MNAVCKATAACIGFGQLLVQPCYEQDDAFPDPVRERGLRVADGTVLELQKQGRKLKGSIATDMGHEREGAGLAREEACAFSTGCS